MFGEDDQKVLLTLTPKERLHILNSITGLYSKRQVAKERENCDVANVKKSEKTTEWRKAKDLVAKCNLDMKLSDWPRVGEKGRRIKNVEDTVIKYFKNKSVVDYFIENNIMNKHALENDIVPVTMRITADGAVRSRNKGTITVSGSLVQLGSICHSPDAQLTFLHCEGKEDRISLQEMLSDFFKDVENSCGCIMSVTDYYGTFELQNLLAFNNTYYRN